MADLYPSMVPGCNFLSWNRCNRKSAMAFRGGALKSTWLLRHHFVKMVHFASWMDLVDPLWGASIRAATTSENPCSLIAVALGTRHVGSGLTGSCAGSGWLVEKPDWADTRVSDWTLPLEPRTRVCWATLVQSEWSCCMGSPVTSPSLCPRWLLVGRHKGPDLPMTGRVHPLPMPGGPALVTQTVVVCCWIWWQTGPLVAGATGSISLGKPLGEGTIPFEWSAQVWIACLLLRSAGRGCDMPWELPVSWCTRTGFSTVGHTRSPSSSPLLCWYRQPLLCCLWLPGLCCLNRGLGTLLGPERPPLAPSDLCATCFLELTRFPLQCIRLSERPTLLLMCL